MRLKKLAAAAAALVMSTALIAGCGDKEDSTSSTGSSDKTSTSTSSGALMQDNFAEQIGTAMQKAGSVHVKLDASGVMTAEGDQTMGDNPADTAMTLSMSVSGMTIDMVLAEQKLFMKMPQLTGDKYAVVDLTDTSNPLTKEFGSLAQQSNVSQQFDAFGEAVQTFEKVDDAQKIDGVDTQAYDVTVDARKLGEVQGQDTTGLPEVVTYRFYVGDDNLVRRMTMDMMGQSLQMDFTDWGKDVSITAPGADEITDLDLGAMMSGAGAG
ncbi:MAG TPA: LppX_LprAFG lipoprotein [Aeromicrobium sp.]|nr:LppX_LprAFG lipoprotein [Aeromicrobium sp.]